MSREQRSVLDRVRQPEYTGANRCVPCTAVNLGIAVVLAGGIAIVAPLAATLVLVSSVAVIYVRGYLVPGTPTLTERYVPDRLLAAFDKHPEPRSGTLETNGDGLETEAGGSVDEMSPDPSDGGASAAIDPESTFLAHDVLIPCSDLADSDGAHPDDDLCLTEDVERAWRREIDAHRGGDREDQVAAFLETDPERVRIVQPRDSGVRALVDDRSVARWESDAALLADLAGATVLATRVADWERLSVENRSRLANGLRTFVGQCSACDGEVSLDEETVESCCRSHQVYAITCEDCNVRILEVPL
ncbi:hypothetical protein EA462_02860 [Natrarchaeobius halalkaliphilus]|uniref:Uncharacterized protein n=1 Tax=Natrarchaeobius halalkaliphilus TaxID=1679091 RepID=A0A3N6MA13_9EURY|nr:hypothetical protein [Natrarchaeobius halalkaliphilus]RQG93160.1 hypothetical protein EA462_02860 [Natrarchaeobius halalkaliphilus]